MFMTLKRRAADTVSAAAGENGKGEAPAKGNRESGAVAEGRAAAACEEPACSTRRAAAATAAACAYGVEPATESPPKPELPNIVAVLLSMPVPVPMPVPMAVGDPDPDPEAETGHELPNEGCSEGRDAGSGGFPAGGCGDELLLPNESEESA